MSRVTGLCETELVQGPLPLISGPVLLLVGHNKTLLM